MCSCHLCSELRTELPAEQWNRPLLESDHFVVLPSLGALVEGWLLLLPREHYLSYGALPEELLPELQAMTHRVSSLVDSNYGPVSIFEHGPARPNCAVGCSVDHAHLHFVPLHFDLKEATNQVASTEMVWGPANIRDCRTAHVGGQDYIYIEQPVGQGIIAKGGSFGSQLIRRAIANRLGMANEFDWRENPHVHRIIATMSTISTVFARHACAVTQGAK